MSQGLTSPLGRIPDGRRILALGGPTCSGKTAIAVAIAAELGGHVISADSRQIYRHMDIGTAKATVAELAMAPHHMVDICDPDQKFTVSDYVQACMEIIAGLKPHVPVIIAGGTGLYFRALLEGLAPLPQADPEFRSSMEKLSSWELHNLLREQDPARADQVHHNNKKRIIRSLEIIRATGKKFSEQVDGVRENPGFRCLKIALNWDREELYRRIDQRVLQMLDQGFQQEVEKLLEMGYSANLNAMTSIGYRQMIAYLRGEMTLEATLETMQRETRNFARRQLTWFRGDGEWKWFDLSQDEFDVTLNKISVLAREFFRGEESIGTPQCNTGLSPGPSQGGTDA